MASLARATVEDGPGPLEGLPTESLVNGVRSALQAGLVDDLDWLAAPAAGQTWDRAFTLKLDPPLGAGEAHDFTQTYTAKGVQNGLLVVGVSTALKAAPKTTGEQVPLVPMLWAGDVYFNPAAGTYHAARLSAKAELTNHLGEGTKYVYQSSYTEDAVTK